MPKDTPIRWRDLHLSSALRDRMRVAARQTRWNAMLEAMSSAHLLGILLVLAALLVQMAIPLDLPTIPLLATVLLAGVLVGLVVGGIHRLTPVEAAVLVDLRLDLKERMSTLVELAPMQPPSPFLPRLQADAVSQVAEREIAKAFPVRIPRRMLWAALSLGVVLVWELAFSGFTLPGTPAHRVALTIREEGKALEQFARELEARARAERLPESKSLSKRLQELGARFQRERLGRVDALNQATELSREVERMRDRLDQRLGSESVNPQGEPPQDLLRRLGALSRKLRSIREMASNPQTEQVDQSPADLLRRLNQLSQEVAELSPGVSDVLEEARRQLQQGDRKGAARSLESAEERLDALQRLLADEEGLSQAQEKLRQTKERIARGAPGPGEAQQEGPPERGMRSSTDTSAKHASGSGEVEETSPPPGPYQGSEPGVGHIESSGPPTPRLDTPKAPAQVRGIPGEGETRWAEVLGEGQERKSRVPVRTAVLSATRDADRHLSRERVPAFFREVVRRYFQELARW